MNQYRKPGGKPASFEYATVTPAPLLLIGGKETALAQRAVESIKTQIKQQFSELEISDIDGETYRDQQIFEVASPSLFGEPRLIRISSLDGAPKQLATDLAALKDSMDDATYIVMTHPGGAKGKAVLDAVRKIPGVVEINCPEIKPADVPALIEAEVRRLGGKIAPEARHALAQCFASNIGELLATCEQLVRDTGGNITPNAVETLTAGRIETTAFQIADSAIAANLPQALVLLRHALASGDSAIAILGACRSKLRGMARMAGEGSQLNQDIFPGQPWMREKAARDVRRWQPGEIAKIIDITAETELQLKGGSRDKEYAMERYLLAIARRGRL
ncbi:MAG: DNA polymerase III subunit delta [Microbacteriaceae bacterium]|nr:DNA polymerase III subunit delta [Microbacteriaceae bacterium]